MTYRMIVTTESIDANGNATSHRETVPHIPADQVEAMREVARVGAPAGSTRTIRVVGQY